MKDIEIEIQVRVEGVELLEDFLHKNGKFTGEKYQKDDYYTPSHRNFLAKEPVEEWLRLRNSQSGSITYKKWHYDENGKSEYCDEYESKIGDVEQLQKILAVLDHELIATVEKTRRTWVYNDYEVAIDKVTSLGDFVEVEYKGTGDVADATKITDGMIAFLKSVGCTAIERNFVGYPFMILYPEKQVFKAV